MLPVLFFAISRRQGISMILPLDLGDKSSVGWVLDQSG
ncbi:hypothetical protein SCH4B_3756 [Ruegeria sp. TrichCH4B]|nr:hypothetical protein SCH4B_3756 [Ruegeria sp. TrichCH4B]